MAGQHFENLGRPLRVRDHAPAIGNAARKEQLSVLIGEKNLPGRLGAVIANRSLLVNNDPIGVGKLLGSVPVFRLLGIASYKDESEMERLRSRLLDLG